MSRRKFAFLVHPRLNVRDDLARGWKPARFLPEWMCAWGLVAVPVPTINWAEVTLIDQANEVAGWILLVPLGARQMLLTHNNLAQRRINAAVDRAVELGAELVGLGALTAPLTKGGNLLAQRSDIGVTNGNAFTAAMTFQGITRLINQCPRSDPHIALVGASGSVGSCVVGLLARARSTSHMTLIARNTERLNALAETTRQNAPDLEVSTSTDMNAVRNADIVVLLTSSAECLLRSEHLKEGALVLDDTQPRNTDPSLASQRPDVLVVDGGLVAAPGAALSGDINLPPGLIYACLAETMLLALNGHQGHFSLGAPTIEQADHVAALARQYPQIGFTLAPWHSFGVPLNQEPVILQERMALA